MPWIAVSVPGQEECEGDVPRRRVRESGLAHQSLSTGRRDKVHDVAPAHTAVPYDVADRRLSALRPESPAMTLHLIVKYNSAARAFARDALSMTRVRTQTPASVAQSDESGGATCPQALKRRRNHSATYQHVIEISLS